MPPAGNDGLFILAFFAGVFLVVLFSILAFKFRYFDVPTLLENWAKANGYQLRRAETRWLAKGPFFWTTSNWQVVYRVTIEDSKGSGRTGWVCIGSFAGFRSDRIEVVWDRKQPEPRDPASQPPRGNPPMWDRDLDLKPDLSGD